MKSISQDFRKLLSLFKKPQVVGLVFGLIFAFLVCEVALRLVGTRQDPLLKCRVSDSELHHLLKAGSVCRSKTSEWDITYRANKLGLRGPEITKKQDGELRILVLGDSFTEGYGVAEQNRFTNLLEQALLPQTTKKLTVVNAGVAGYSPVLELELLKKYYDEIMPDVVLVALDMTDFKDEIGYYNFLSEKSLNSEAKKDYFAEVSQINLSQAGVQGYKEKSGWQRNKNLSFINRLKMFLRKSELYVLVTNFLKDRANMPYLVYGSPPFIKGDIETDAFAIARRNLDPAVYKSLWVLPRRSFTDINAFSHEKNFKLLFFTYPHGMQVDGKQWGQGRLTRGFKRGVTYSTRALEDFAALGNELNVPTLNMLDIFRANADKKLFFDFDGHFSAEGHSVAAKALMQFVVDNVEGLK